MSLPVEAARAELIGTTVGPYRIASLLGAGGMGQVYLGEHPTIGSRVAIKVLSRDCLAHPELVERFFAEARAANRIRHEGIVNVLDLAHLADGRPYIVMEHLAGAPLNAIIARGGALPLGSFVRVVVEVLDALAAAHHEGVIHRDLKPDNIFVTPNGRAKILDFGIAKLMPGFGHQSSETKTGALLGTPHYMAPEQIRGAPVDARTDLYAIGGILYEGVTGVRPFAGATLYELFQQHLEAAPVPPTQLRPELPQSLEHIIACALAKRPEERFGSASAMAKALASVAGELPESAWGALVDGDGHLTIGPASGRLSTPARPTPSAELLGQLPTERASQSADATLRDPAARKWPLAAAVLAALLGGAVIALLATGSPNDPGDTVAAASAEGDSGTVTTEAGDEASDQAGPARLDRSEAGADPTGDRADDPQPTPGPGGTPEAATPATRAGSPGRAPRPPKGSTPGTEGAGSADQPTAAAPPSADSATATKGDPTLAERAAASGVTLIETRSAPGKESFNVPVDFDPRRFDAIAYLAKAQGHARKVFSDAVLVEFEVPAVYPTGHADLSLGSGLEASYYFRSPSRSGRPKDLPRGVEVDLRCMVYVDVTRKSVEVYATTSSKCNEPRRPSPRCSLEEVWDRARKQGAPGGKVVAKISYLWDGWFLDIDGEFSDSIKDDC